MPSDEAPSRAILSIRSKLTLLVFALVAIVAVFAGWLSYAPLRDAVDESFRGQVEKATASCAAKIEARLGNERRLLAEQSKRADVITRVSKIHATVTRPDLLSNKSKEDAYELCTSLRDLSGHWLAVSVLDEKGRFRAACDLHWIDKSPAEIFRDLEGDADGLPTRPFRFHDTWVVAITAPVMLAGREIERGGRLVVLLDLEWVLSDVANDVSLAAEHRLICAGAPVRGARPFYRGGAKDDAALDASVFDAPRASGLFELENAKRLPLVAARSLVDPIGGELALVVDAAEQRAALAAVRGRFGWILAGVLLMGTLGAFLLARHVTEPILQLVRAAERVAAGERGVQVAERGRDEIGRLVEGFNRMTAELDRSYQTLERRVRERTAELESLNAEISSFSHSVAHDLRAPLRAIAGYGDILCDEKTLALDPESREMLERMRYNARRLGQLIDDLLAFSGIGRRELCIRAVDPARIVRDVLDDFEHVTRGRRIDFELRELAGCEADEALLSLVFSNLLSNAIKYTRRREHALIVIGCEKRDGESVYYVRDNGVGFDMRHATELFGIFQRLHARDEFEGTGVGLAIARRVVERHGGRIWAEARPDQGATFWFALGRVGVGPKTRATREMAVA